MQVVSSQAVTTIQTCQFRMMKGERCLHLFWAVGLTFVRIIVVIRPRLGFNHFGPTAGNATVGLAILVKKTSSFGVLRTNPRARRCRLVQIGLDFLPFKRQTAFALGTPFCASFTGRMGRFSASSDAESWICLAVTSRFSSS